MKKKERQSILRLFKSYNQHPDYPWYRKVANETRQGKQLSAEACVEIQCRGGPDAIHLRPDLFPPSGAMMDLIVVMQSDTHNEIDVYGAVINLIRNDYSALAQGIPACRQETQNL